MSSPKPYYQDDAVTIYHADCRDILPHLPKVDLVLTDPPYGMDFVSNRHGDRYETYKTKTRPVSSMGDEDTSLRDWVLDWWGDRPALIFGTWKRPRPHNTKHVLIWRKGDHLGMGDLSIPWRPDLEEIYVIGSGFKGHRGTSLLYYQAPVSWASRGRYHPHEKPVSLIKALLLKCPFVTILDPFLGSGTTARACKDLGRKCIGIEIEERYCEIAARRMAQTVMELGV